MRFAFWDGSDTGASPVDGVVRVHSPLAVRRILWAPDQLGLARAYVAGELDIDGDVYAMLTALRDAVPTDMRLGWQVAPAALTAARRLGVLGPPPPPPDEERRLHGWRHSVRRDSRAISHHYDVGNDFYRLVLGPAMTYSCAYFASPDLDLAGAQAAKHELICRKLGLHERAGMRLLDVGCGWGSLAIHAAREHGAQVVGITLSREQVHLARQRLADAEVSDRVEIRLQDYRDLHDETFDAIASVGMSEHVGGGRISRYFRILRDLLVPEGRLLNHAISSVDGSRLGRRSFVGRYVFPDGELLDVGDTVLAMEHAGLEVRDVEALREHYATTLRCWVANLEAAWDEAVALAGPGRARVWRLYMAGSAIGFADAGLSVHQVLGVRTTVEGRSGVPPTRAGWT
ncbi:MAG TPA: cyclopropane-fatty-acyl-phospholipid synthase family protein [Euzebyales bacterium]|nr:cyclopropane-fatty-acyl-phospholipid synthase family protein [Euzebyales bacterium]